MQGVNMQIGETPRLEWIELSSIYVDASYQRPVKQKRILQILRDFTWAQFGALMLVEQADGRFSVYDGQHRYEAARKHPLIQKVPASIVKLDEAYLEAQSFLGVNINRSAISTVEKYWAGIEAGDENMMRICAVLEEAGCDVVPAGTKSKAPHLTASVSAIERAIRAYGDQAVTLACKAIVEAWPKDTSALSGTVIQATARLFRNNSKIISYDRMVLKLKGKNRAILSADAEAIRRISGSDAALSVAKALVEIYNKGLQINEISIGAKK